VGRIHVLSDALVNRIAAGEVVERPSAVVKELLENAIDAGARSIAITCEAGGVRRIAVEDDGTGMDRDDAVLAFERHATSKIHGANDLDAISTLGFRGEALASIAAVARVRLETSVGDGPGTEVEVHGGTMRAVRPIGRARGTTIEVARLFANVPARRKFLRSETTELGHIARAVHRVALAHPDLRLRLAHDGRVLLAVDPAPDLGERLAQIYGRDLARRLLRVESAEDEWGVSGFVGRPADAAPRRDSAHLFVNGRPVQDRLLAHALAAAYANTMPAGRAPWAFLFVRLAPSLVDVNVHPQKLEVRFHRPGEIHDRLRDSVHAALGNESSAVPSLGDLRPQSAVSAHLLAADRPAPIPHVPSTPRVAEPRSVSSWNGEPVRCGIPDEPRQPALGAASRAKPLAQYADSYIVATDEQGLLLVDQHAAHERVLFERFLAEAQENRVEVQRLLFPATVDLSASELVAVERDAEELRRLGFLVEPFGGSTVRIDGVPALAANLDAPSLVREIASEAARARSVSADAPAIRHRLVTTAACRAAIKIHHPLTQPEMQRLLDDLFAAESPTTCPHGRPVVFRLPHDEIERAFRRR